MISADEVKKLAALSRIKLTTDEITALQSDIVSILKYIDIIQKVDLPKTSAVSPHMDIENVMREDATPHDSGAFSKQMLTQAPRRDGAYLKVKKILP